MKRKKKMALSKASSHDIRGELSSSEVLKSIFEVAPFAMNLWDKNMINLMCNAYILDMFSIEDGNEFLDRFFEFSPSLQPNGISSKEMAQKNFEKAIKDGKHVFHWMHLTPSGDEFPVEITLVKLDVASAEGYIIGFIKDLRSDFIYGKLDSKYDFYFTDKLPKSILMSEVSQFSNEWYFSVDLRTHKFFYYSKLWFSGFGGNTVITEEQFLNGGFIHEDDIDVYKKMMDGIRSGTADTYDIRFINDDKEYRYNRVSCKLILDSSGVPVFGLGKGMDVHEQRVFEERSQKDLLTDCFNKISAENIISAKLLQNPDATHVFFIVDIDNFKAINDNLGHYFGDEVLREIAAGLKSAFREIDTVARIGGDEFIIFVENLSDIKIIKKKAEKILEVYRKSYSGEYKDYSISGSVGIATYPHNGMTYNDLYQNSDKALNQAKMQGKNRYMLYSEDLNIGTTRSTTKIENANRIASSFFDYDLISAVFNVLYERNGDRDSINLALSYLCQKYNADRSYIFETLDEGLTLNNTFEYCKDGISSEIQNLQGIPYGLFEDFLEKAHNDIIYSNDLRETLEQDRAFEIMDDQGIMSFVHAQIKRDGQMTFFIGLDDCTKTRVWTEREINSLQYIGKLISVVQQGSHLTEKMSDLAVRNRNSDDILNSSDSIVYVSDLDTFELLYLNKPGRDAVGFMLNEDLSGKKCYKVLQGKDKPCDFCTNHLLKEDDYYEWSYYNPVIDKTFLLKDKLMQFNGRLARLEIATDISKVVALEKTLKDKLSDEHFLMSCVEMLHSGNEPDNSIYLLLKAVCEYYNAERSYIFERSDCGNFISNTYEYCKDGNEPYIGVLQNLPLDDLSILLNKCNTDEAFSMNIYELDETSESLEYELMKIQNLTDIIISSIKVEGKEITGFVGVDNSKRNQNKTSIIKTVAKFTANFLDETKLTSTLNRLSYYDTLTGIKNRHSYSVALKEINSKNIDSLGVAYVDIMALSVINETNGMDFGDNVLIKVSQMLSSIFNDNVFRVGGDEFVVISENVSEADFEKNISDLKEKLKSETEFNTSVGYTWNRNLKNKGSDLSEFYEGENYSQILLENLEMEINDGKYIVHLQPQINLETGKIQSAEALVRRMGAGGVLQAPIFFLPFYEKEGIISKIDEFVFEEVCKTIKSWQDKGRDILSSVSVNCSRMTIAQKDIVEKFTKLCDKHGVKHSKIAIEITETINGIGEEMLARIIKNFSDAGFLVSLDDFGSGYSNLTSLVVSDFDEIKIDMKIIEGIHKNNKSKALTEAAITLCEKLDDLTSVAEGVEDKLQHEMLCEMNCKLGQGYYYSQPLSIEKFEDEFIF